MDRQDLIGVTAENTEASEAATMRFLDSLTIIVQNEVAKGGAVKLVGLGTLGKAAVATRTGRNPKTDAPIKIPSTHKPEFTPGATFKDLVKD